MRPSGLCASKAALRPLTSAAASNASFVTSSAKSWKAWGARCTASVAASRFLSSFWPDGITSTVSSSDLPSTSHEAFAPARGLGSSVPSRSSMYSPMSSKNFLMSGTTELAEHDISLAITESAMSSEVPEGMPSTSVMTTLKLSSPPLKSITLLRPTCM